MGLDGRSPGRFVDGRQGMANNLEFLAISQKTAACYRDAGGPFGADAGTLVS
jgi:hypothetical protein